MREAPAKLFSFFLPYLRKMSVELMKGGTPSLTKDTPPTSRKICEVVVFFEKLAFNFSEACKKPMKKNAQIGFVGNLKRKVLIKKWPLERPVFVYLEGSSVFLRFFKKSYYDDYYSHDQIICHVRSVMIDNLWYECRHNHPYSTK